MASIRWSEIAKAGLVRLIPADRVDSARTAIDLKLRLGIGLSLRRHPAFPDRQIYVFTQFAGVILRIVVETGDDTVVWHVGKQPPAVDPTE